MKIATVSVIEYFNGTINMVTAFSDDPAGNAEAELLFERIAKENGMDEADKDICLEEGMFEQGDYQVFLTHSEMTEA
jgi:hypothetical protein